MNSNPIQSRMSYIRQLQNHLIESLFVSTERQMGKSMWAIAQENQTLIGGNVTPTFIFDGRWYPLPKPPNATECNKILHPTLRKKVHELVNFVDLNDRDIRAGIESMIGNVLSVAKNTEDLEKLLPETIVATMPRIDPKVFDIGAPMSDMEIQEIQEHNAINMRYFKRMLMTQLLLAKT